MLKFYIRIVKYIKKKVLSFFVSPLRKEGGGEVYVTKEKSRVFRIND